jgi:hypothetical protein
MTIAMRASDQKCSIVRPEWRNLNGQQEREQRNHRSTISDSIKREHRMRFSVHTGSARAPSKLRKALCGVTNLDRRDGYYLLRCASFY